MTAVHWMGDHWVLIFDGQYLGTSRVTGRQAANACLNTRAREAGLREGVSRSEMTEARRDRNELSGHLWNRATEAYEARRNIKKI